MQYLVVRYQQLRRKQPMFLNRRNWYHGRCRQKRAHVGVRLCYCCTELLNDFIVIRELGCNVILQGLKVAPFGFMRGFCGYLFSLRPFRLCRINLICMLLVLDKNELPLKLNPVEFLLQKDKII